MARLASWPTSYGLRIGLMLAAVGLLAPQRASAYDLYIDSASLSFDPNADTWYVTAKVCNSDSGGTSGSVLLELRLYTSDGAYYSIGSGETFDQVDGGFCLTWSGYDIDVNTDVPTGEYDIGLTVGEYDGGSYVAADSTTFDSTFISGSGGGGGGGGAGGSAAPCGIGLQLYATFSAVGLSFLRISTRRRLHRARPC